MSTQRHRSTERPDSKVNSGGRPYRILWVVSIASFFNMMMVLWAVDPGGCFPILCCCICKRFNSHPVYVVEPTVPCLNDGVGGPSIHG